MSRKRAARLGVMGGAWDQVSAVFLACHGADRAARRPLRTLISARSPGGGVMDVETDTAFDALRSVQDFLLLRGGDRLLILVIHGVLQVRRSGELVFPISDKSYVTSSQLRATLRSAEIEWQAAILDCDVAFDAPPAQGRDAEMAFAEILARALKTKADNRLVLARRPNDAVRLTPRLGAALAAKSESDELYREDLVAAAQSLNHGGGAPPIMVGASEITPREQAVRQKRMRKDAAEIVPAPESDRERNRRGAASVAVPSSAPQDAAPQDAIGDADPMPQEAESEAPANAADESLAKITDGRLHHDIPSSMLFGQAYEISIAVSRDPSEAVKAGLGAAGAPVLSEDIRVSGLMSVELRDPEDAFDMHALTPARQGVDHRFARAKGFRTNEGSDRGVWRWRVRPRRRGAYPLCIEAIALIRDDHGQLIPAPEQNDRIAVTVSVNYALMAREAAQWIGAGFMGYVLFNILLGPAAENAFGRMRDATIKALGLGGVL